MRIALVVLVALAAPAYAHQTAIKYVEVALDGEHATIALKVAPGDVTTAMGLPVDAKPTPAAAARLARHAGVRRVVARDRTADRCWRLAVRAGRGVGERRPPTALSS